MASPLRWFRRHAKVMMVVLGSAAMAIFGLGPVFNTLSHPTPKNKTEKVHVATWKEGDISRKELDNLRVSHYQTQRFLRELMTQAADQQGEAYQPLAQPIAPLQENRQTSQADIDKQLIDRILWAKQAEEEGIVISDGAVDDYLAMLAGGAEFTRNDLIQMNRDANNKRCSLENIRRNLKFELAVEQMTRLVGVGLPTVPNPTDSAQLYRQLTERVQGEVLPIPVDQYLQQVENETPDTAELKKLYEAGKSRYPDPYSNEPGFKIPNRVKVQYFEASYDTFLQNELNKLTDEDVQKEYERLVKIKSDIVMETIPQEDDNSFEIEDESLQNPDSENDSKETPSNNPDLDAPPELPSVDPSTPKMKEDDTPGPPPATEEKPTPQTEEPKAEEPKTEQPKAEQPKAEEPKAEQPKAEQPKAEEPKAEEPKAEEPKAEQPKAEEPKAEQPKAEEPKAEEPKAEEPKAEEPKAEEPQAPDASDEEPDTDSSFHITRSKTQFVSTTVQEDGDVETPEPAATDSSDDPGPPPTDEETDTNAPSTEDETTPTDSPDAATTPSGQNETEPNDPVSNPPSDTTVVPTPNLGNQQELPKRVRPLAEVVDAVKRSMVAEDARKAMNKAINRAYGVASDYATDRMIWESEPEDIRGEAPAPIDYEAIAKKYNLVLHETDLVDVSQLFKTKIGKVLDRQHMAPLASVIFSKYDSLKPYDPQKVVPISLDGYLYWITQKEDATIPSFDVCRPEVEAFWRKQKAIALAQAEGQKIAKRVQSEGKRLSELYGDRVKETGEFTWLTIPPSNGFRPSIRFGNPFGIEAPGQELMQTIFSLKENEVGSAINQRHDTVYVFQMLSPRKSSEAIANDYLDNQFFRFKQIPANVKTANEWYQRRAIRDWRDQFTKSMQLEFKGK